MLVSPQTSLTFRHVDVRSVPDVHCISLRPHLTARRDDTTPTQTQTQRQQQHVGLALNRPFFLTRFDDIGGYRDSRVAQERAAYRDRTRKRRMALQKWNHFNRQGTEHEKEHGGHAHLSPQVLLAFACGYQALAQAQHFSSSGEFSVSADSYRLHLRDAEFLSSMLKVPLCVVLSSWSDLPTRTSHAEVYLRMNDAVTTTMPDDEN